MPKLYARQTVLHNVAGRIDYIGNPDRQEHLLAYRDTAADLLDGQFWKVLAAESRASFEKFGQKSRMVKNRDGNLIEQMLDAVEARELVFKLDNDVLDRKSPEEILQSTTDRLEADLNRPVCAALHYNRKKNNLHIHVIFPERELLDQLTLKVAPRALFFDEQGKRCYKKGEILDDEGQLRPGCRIVPKGEVYESRCFGSVDQRFASKGWLKGVKTNTVLPLLNGPLKGSVEIREYDPSTGELAQQHVGNALMQANPEKAEEIWRYNRMVVRYNDLVVAGVIPREDALMLQAAVNASKDKASTLEMILDHAHAEDLPKIEPPRDGRKKALDDIITGAAKKAAADAELWRRYRQIRDDAWEIFLEAQRREMRAIRELRQENYLLYLANSTSVGTDENGKEIRRMNSRDKLEVSGYFEDRQANLDAMQTHRDSLKQLRACQEVAKERQAIMRSLLLAGADEAAIREAMQGFEQAMRLLQQYAADPDADFEGRRLKAARWSAEQARKRAEAHVQRLTKERETSTLMEAAEREYQAFEATGEVSDQDVSQLRAQDPAKDPVERRSTERR